jgi:hypothetical protein
MMDVLGNRAHAAIIRRGDHSDVLHGGAELFWRPRMMRSADADVLGRGERPPLEVLSQLADPPEQAGAVEALHGGAAPSHRAALRG